MKGGNQAFQETFDSRRNKFYQSVPAEFWKDHHERVFWKGCGMSGSLDEAVHKFLESAGRAVEEPPQQARAKAKAKAKATQRTFPPQTTTISTKQPHNPPPNFHFQGRTPKRMPNFSRGAGSREPFKDRSGEGRRCDPYQSSFPTSIKCILGVGGRLASLGEPASN